MYNPIYNLHFMIHSAIANMAITGYFSMGLYLLYIPFLWA